MLLLLLGEGEPHAHYHFVTWCPDLQDTPLTNPDLILFVDVS